LRKKILQKSQARTQRGAENLVAPHQTEINRCQQGEVEEAGQANSERQDFLENQSEKQSYPENRRIDPEDVRRPLERAARGAHRLERVEALRSGKVTPAFPSCRLKRLAREERPGRCQR